MHQPRVRDLGIFEIERLQVSQPFKMHQPRIAKLSSVEAERLEIPQRRSTGDVRFSSDGQWLANASADSVWLLNLESGNERVLSFQ